MVCDIFDKKDKVSITGDFDQWCHKKHYLFYTQTASSNGIYVVIIPFNINSISDKDTIFKFKFVVNDHNWITLPFFPISKDGVNGSCENNYITLPIKQGVYRHDDNNKANIIIGAIEKNVKIQFIDDSGLKNVDVGDTLQDCMCNSVSTDNTSDNNLQEYISDSASTSNKSSYADKDANDNHNYIASSQYFNEDVFIQVIGSDRESDTDKKSASIYRFGSIQVKDHSEVDFKESYANIIIDTDDNLGNVVGKETLESMSKLSKNKSSNSYTIPLQLENGEMESINSSSIKRNSSSSLYHSSLLFGSESTNNNATRKIKSIIRNLFWKK
ncbi:Atg45p SCDLUD_000392 [Saccharomycodes ludwigii]|uniref:Atg45p n=1 Tax=Saccharomycodes ludwigii TaxID=36035 RepID=UPI001E8C0BA1|nr:hypothetical protein SCDLUD_000392 [Saccharomycodes ludwigii]KAH3902801.1 hypothetical protein SCDLUD_000392 [Saccharomycodes ludwigii]